MSFYQKYRPKKIAELDLALVRESLLSVLKSGSLSHAYLFVGPRGSGKTSTARILAQVVNCELNAGKKENLSEPCGECSACKAIAKGGSVDVIEIDAASSGLVDDIRDLREKVRLAPIQLRKKVYIIDEVHMVSPAGFNALLKTLEEPPSHVMFMLCTTEAQKVPETISSRCTRVAFVKASIEEVVGSLLKAVTGEGLEIEKEALTEIAMATDGSFREGHKLLEQLAGYGKILNVELVRQSLGVAGRQSVCKLLRAAKDKDAEEVIAIFAKMEETGIKASVLGASLLDELKESVEKGMLARETVVTDLFLIDKLIEAMDKIKISPLPLLPLEIALLSLVAGDLDTGGEAVKKKTVNTEKKEDVKSVMSEEKTDEVSNISVQEYNDQLASFDKIKTEWGDFLKVMSGSCGSLAGMLRLVSPVDLKGKALILEVSSRFQQDMLEREVKKKMIEEQMAKIWGPMTFHCVLGDRGAMRTEPEPQDANLEPVDTKMTAETNVMNAAEKIFGG